MTDTEYYEKFKNDINSNDKSIREIAMDCFDYNFISLFDSYGINWRVTNKEKTKHQIIYIRNKNNDILISIDYTHSLRPELLILFDLNKRFIVRFIFSRVMSDVLFSYYIEEKGDLNKALELFSGEVYREIYKSLEEYGLYE